jgi:hypothetical protein
MINGRMTSLGGGGWGVPIATSGGAQGGEGEEVITEAELAS